MLMFFIESLQSIPEAFFKYLKFKKRGKAMLRSPCAGGQLTELWPVKINGGRITQGWVEFAVHLDLKVGDFLVFGLESDDLVLNVTVFDSSGCEREYGTDGV